jgi:two-component system, response regulator PdtaR
MTTAKQPKVLVAEDDPLVAMSLHEMLSRFGLEVVGVAAAVSDALRIAQTTRPDIAIFDVTLRGKRDGIEGAVLLRSFLDIPVVFLTGQGDEGTRARALAVNRAAYLCKPARPQDILAAVDKALGPRGDR